MLGNPTTDTTPVKSFPKKSSPYWIIATRTDSRVVSIYIHISTLQDCMQHDITACILFSTYLTQHILVMTISIRFNQYVSQYMIARVLFPFIDQASQPA